MGIFDRLRRRTDTGPGVVTPAPAGPVAAAPSAVGASGRGWQGLPPIQRATAGSSGPAVAIADFGSRLVTWQNPSFVGPLSHAVLDGAPGGLLRDALTPAAAPSGGGLGLPVLSLPVAVADDVPEGERADTAGVRPPGFPVQRAVAAARPSGPRVAALAALASVRREAGRGAGLTRSPAPPGVQHRVLPAASRRTSAGEPPVREAEPAGPAPAAVTDPAVLPRALPRFLGLGPFSGRWGPPPSRAGARRRSRPAVAPRPPMPARCRLWCRLWCRLGAGCGAGCGASCGAGQRGAAACRPAVRTPDGARGFRPPADPPSVRVPTRTGRGHAGYRPGYVRAVADVGRAHRRPCATAAYGAGRRRPPKGYGGDSRGTGGSGPGRLGPGRAGPAECGARRCTGGTHGVRRCPRPEYDAGRCAPVLLPGRARCPVLLLRVPRPARQRGLRYGVVARPGPARARGRAVRPGQAAYRKVPHGRVPPRGSGELRRERAGWWGSVRPCPPASRRVRVQGVPPHPAARRSVALCCPRRRGRVPPWARVRLLRARPRGGSPRPAVGRTLLPGRPQPVGPAALSQPRPSPYRHAGRQRAPPRALLAAARCSARRWPARRPGCGRLPGSRRARPPCRSRKPGPGTRCRRHSSPSRFASRRPARRRSPLPLRIPVPPRLLWCKMRPPSPSPARESG